MTFRTELRAFALGAAMAFLAGCGQELVLVTNADDYELSTKSFRAHLAETGGVGLVVINGPTAPSKADIDKRLASLIRVVSTKEIPVTPIADTTTANRIVLVFNPAKGEQGNLNRICAGKLGEVGTHLETGTLFLYGALCASDSIVSHGMTISANIAPMDPRFQDVMNAMAIALFPPNPRGDRSSCLMC